jgi:hypothetical protein
VTRRSDRRSQAAFSQVAVTRPGQSAPRPMLAQVARVTFVTTRTTNATKEGDEASSSKRSLVTVNRVISESFSSRQ